MPRPISLAGVTSLPLGVTPALGTQPDFPIDTAISRSHNNFLESVAVFSAPRRAYIIFAHQFAISPEFQRLFSAHAAISWIGSTAPTCIGSLREPSSFSGGQHRTPGVTPCPDRPVRRLARTPVSASAAPPPHLELHCSGRSTPMVHFLLLCSHTRALDEIDDAEIAELAENPQSIPSYAWCDRCVTWQPVAELVTPVPLSNYHAPRWATHAGPVADPSATAARTGSAVLGPRFDGTPGTASSAPYTTGQHGSSSRSEQYAR